MKNFFRAFQWKAQYYWTLLREWANQGRPRWAYSILLACALALTGCGDENVAERNSPVYKHQFASFRIGADDAQINDYMTQGWTTAAIIPFGGNSYSQVVVLKKPLPVEVAKPKNGVRK